MKKPFHPILGSSVNRNQLSLTIKSLALSLIPITVATLGLADITVSPEELTDLINTVFAAVTACGVALGVARKIYYKITN
jgi:hypothetical protein